MTHPLPFVSVLIPARDEEAHIGRCLASVLAQDYPGERMEVLVIDNGSSDATATIAKEILLADGRGRVLRKSGGTIASVRNHGWRHARGEILAFLDGDSVVEPQWLETGLTLLASAPDISCVGFAVAAPQPADSWVERAWFPISSSGKRKGTGEVHWLSSFNLLLKRQFFEQVGGFDEALATCEDADLGSRLCDISRLIFSDRCRVRHLGTVTTLGAFLRKEYWRGKNSLTSLLRNRNKRSELLSVVVPLCYLLLAAAWLAALACALLCSRGGWVAGVTGALLLAIPCLLALRSGIRSPSLLASASVLFAFYLVARGAAVVPLRQ